ncbi:MAG: AAA family ATPase [Mariprofundales bacterium]
MHDKTKTAQLRTAIDALTTQLMRAVAGKDIAIRQLLITLFCGGHLLIEDVPGVGKTTLAHALAKSLHSDFGRIQFTADLLPADIVGVEIYDPSQHTFQFHPGAIFHHIVLADEINRATPKAQSALLEAMAEGQVTIERETRMLPQPFFVIATQNPQEQVGTYPLPESQMDRFFMRLQLGYPDSMAERQLLTGAVGRSQLSQLKPIADWSLIEGVQAAMQTITVSDALLDYLLKLLETSRNGEFLRLGISPRAGQDLLQAARANAWLDGRAFVTAADVQCMWLPCLAHRVSVDGDSRAALMAVLEQVAVPG